MKDRIADAVTNVVAGMFAVAALSPLPIWLAWSCWCRAHGQPCPEMRPIAALSACAWVVLVPANLPARLGNWGRAMSALAVALPFVVAGVPLSFALPAWAVLAFLYLCGDGQSIEMMIFLMILASLLLILEPVLTGHHHHQLGPSAAHVGQPMQ